MEPYLFYNNSLNQTNKMLRQNLINSKFFYSPSLYEHSILKYDLFLTNLILLSLNRLYSLPWKIKFFNNKYNIENNYPHTHNDTIFFPNMYFTLSQSERINLLIHEKIHIYQRYYPIPYHKILFNYYNLKVKQLVFTHQDFENVRQNPDNNLLIYTDNNEYILPVFIDNPSSIADVKHKVYNKHNNNTSYSKLNKNEHPNETFAYYLTNAILKNEIPNFIKSFI